MAGERGIAVLPTVEGQDGKLIKPMLESIISAECLISRKGKPAKVERYGNTR
jgi:hypothetical protein